MSGICGFVSSNKSIDPPARRREILELMAKRLAHRGPGGQIFYEDDFAALVQLLPPPSTKNAQPEQPLSITISPFAGSSPPRTMPAALVFDGQIYNLPQLQKGKLIPSAAAGLPPFVDRRSRILISLYEEHGRRFPSMLRGSFAFALWDGRRRCLLLARDRFGIKPLYYAQADHCMVFASEAKALLAHPLIKPALNLSALPHYLTFQYFPGEESAFRGIFRLPPATVLLKKEGQEPAATRYWQIRFNPRRPGKSLSYYAGFAKQLLTESVRLHGETALPIGAFLSSGVDSSLMAALLTIRQGPIHTFSVNCAGGRYDELKPARETATLLSSIHHEHEIDPHEFWEALPEAIWHQDEPLADPSAIALFLACRLAAKEVKVVLSGEGADELFGGYTIYRQPASLAPLRILPSPVKHALRRIGAALPPGFKGKNFLQGGLTPLERRYFGNAFIFSEVEKELLLNRELFPESWAPPWQATAPFYRRSRYLDDLSRMQFLDFSMWLPGDILAKADRMPAACSLELRTPFLDHRLVEMAAAIPSSYKIRQKITKYVLREAASYYLLPQISFRPKLGFPVPTDSWIRGPYSHRLREIFLTSPAASYFNLPYLLKMLDRHLEGSSDYGRKLWTIAVFLLWHRLYLE